MKQQERSSSARQCILSEAEHLIHIQGYNCTSLEDIACRCKMTKANLLHHFRSKEELGLAVLDFKISAYQRRRLDSIFTENADPIEAVSKLFSEMQRSSRANSCKAGCFIANIALEMSDANDRFRARAAQYFEDWASNLENLLSHHQKKGRFQPSFDPKGCAEAILSLYEGAIMLARTRRDPKVFERTGRIAVGILKSQERKGARAKALA